jgi:hypothetical protein
MNKDKFIDLQISLNEGKQCPNDERLRLKSTAYKRELLAELD